jgi:hypothetical protein
MQTWQEWSRLAFSPDGSDTAHDISEEQLASAIEATGNLLVVADLLTEAHGRIVAREDIVRRVEASPQLQRVLEDARATYMERALTKGLQRAADNRRLEALKRERREGPHCGARCQDGHACQRRPVPGRTRCPSHNGRTPTARRTPLARALRR